MKFGVSTFAIIFIGFFIWFAYNHFQFSTMFWFSKTEEIKGFVTEIDWTPIRGGHLQEVKYRYTVNDSIYNCNYTVGRSNEKYNGQRLLIKYAIRKPEKNKVIGYYK